MEATIRVYYHRGSKTKTSTIEGTKDFIFKVMHDLKCADWMNGTLTDFADEALNREYNEKYNN